MFFVRKKGCAYKDICINVLKIYRDSHLALANHIFNYVIYIYIYIYI